jgi:hypothetical protein
MTRLIESEQVISRYVPAKDGAPPRIELGDKFFEPKANRKKKPRHR